MSFYLPKLDYSPYENEYQLIVIMLFETNSKNLIKCCSANNPDKMVL